MSEDKMGTVSRAMAVLTVIAEAESDVAIIDLAAALDLPQSTCHRLLDLLAVGGFVQRNAKLRRYGPGPNLQRMAALVMERTDLMALAAPIMAKLTAESGETSLLGRYSPKDRTLHFIHSEDAPNPIRYRIGLFEPLPVGQGASGRAVAAYLPAEEIEAVHQAVRERWPTAEGFAIELATIRAGGYAISRGEKLEGAVGIGAPVFGPADTIVGSLAVTIPEQRFEPSRLDVLAGQVKKAAGELSRLQGARSGAPQT